MVSYGGQHDASTSEVSLVSQPRMCHNDPPISYRVNPSQLQKSQRCPEKSTQDNKLKVNAATSSVNLLTSVSMPMCMASQNRTLQQFSALSDHALTKVNAGQTSLETLAAEISSFLLAVQIRPSSSHVWAELYPPRSSY